MYIHLLPNSCLDRLAHCGIFFSSVGKSLRNGKKPSTCLHAEICTEQRLYIQKSKTKSSEIQFQWRNKWPQYYITFHVKAGSEKWQILLVLGNWQFRKLSAFCFYFRKIFPCVYLTKQHNDFTKEKSHRTSLFTAN